MEITVNQIIDYYAHASVTFLDVFTNKMEPGRQDVGRTTAPGKCGSPSLDVLILVSMALLIRWSLEWWYTRDLKCQ